MLVTLTHDVNQQQDFQFHRGSAGLRVHTRLVLATAAVVAAAVAITVGARLCIVVTRPARPVSSHVAPLAPCPPGG